MPQAAPPPPRSTPRAEPRTGACALTTAAWNRRREQGRPRGLPHRPRGLRAVPMTLQPLLITRLFGALFMALPGLALVVFVAMRAGTALACATLLMVAVHASLHALATWKQAHDAMTAPWLRRVDAHAPGLLLCASLLPLLLAAGTIANAPLALCATLLAAACSGVAAAMQRRAERRSLLADALLVLGSVCSVFAVAVASAAAAA